MSKIHTEKRVIHRMIPTEEGVLEQEQVIVPVQANQDPVYRFIKRTFDIVLALVAGAVLLIPMLIVGLLVRIETKGPAIFKQKRLGKHGKEFRIYKFRTMRTEAPSELATREFTDAHKYITRIGKFLRRTSFDELPQLLNIIKGDMSFVGYRPVCVTETKLNGLRKEYGIFAVRPGLTGYAQVQGRDNIDHWTKAALDAEYVSKRSIKMDLWCLVKTFTVIFEG